MQQRVTAVVVVRSGADHLQRTLASLASQSRPADSTIAIDVESVDRSREILQASDVAALTSAPSGTSFGDAVVRAISGLPPASGESEWIWLLSHDSAPRSRALEALLAAVEIAPSVAVAGPKSMASDAPDTIVGFGETITRFGRSVSLVEGELDQAQHDVQADVLGIAAAGMLVRRSVFETLGGFDSKLSTVDAGLDFCVRARLAGHRVIGVPAAKVATASATDPHDDSALRAGRLDRARARRARAAQLHRRLVYAPAAVVLLHLISFLPLAALRSIGHLLGKHPGYIPGEFAAALTAMLSGGSVSRARRSIARTRAVSWAAIAPLRLSTRDARARRSLALERRLHANEPAVEQTERADFFASGGVWAVVGAAAAGVIANARLLGAESLTGGALIPLSADPGALWQNVGYGWRDIGVGLIGAADPFALVLAVLGSITFWNPSLSIVIVMFVAMPVSALGAWLAARRLVTRTWVPAVAAVLWGLAPSLLASIHAGRLGATIAHILLPYLVLLALRAPRSWAASAGAALVLAVIAASAPVLVPALIVALVMLIALRPRGAHRLIPTVIPTAVLFTPLVIDQLARGNPLGLLADPGVPTARPSASGIQLALGAPAGGSDGWTAFLDKLAQSGAAAPFIVGALILPLALLALATLVIPRAGRGVSALVLALTGFVTAVAASRLDVSSVSSSPVGIWPGSGVSLFWLGLLGAAVIALDRMRRQASPGSGLLLTVATVLIVIPLLAPTVIGAAAIEPGGRRTLPAFVEAEAQTNPDIGTLVIAPVDDDTISATLQRGRGDTLDDQSTLAATATTLSADEEAIAQLAANLISRSGFDAEAVLNERAIGFVVVEEADPRAPAELAVTTRAREALDSNPLFSPVGETANGLLWRYLGSDAGLESIDRPSPLDTTWGVLVLVGFALVFGITLIVAIPTGESPRRRAIARTIDPDPAPSAVSTVTKGTDR